MEAIYFQLMRFIVYHGNYSSHFYAVLLRTGEYENESNHVLVLQNALP